MTEQEFFDEMNLARDFMCSTKTTHEQWDALIKRLGIIYIRHEAPQHLRYIAEGQLLEAVRRRAYVEVGI